MYFLFPFSEYKKTGPKDGGGKREKFTLFQLMVLCRFYEEDHTPNLNTRSLLAEKLDVPLDRVTIWFQNQRARGFPAKKILSQANFTRKSVDMGFNPNVAANHFNGMSNPGATNNLIGSPAVGGVAQDQTLSRLFQTVGLNGANTGHMPQFAMPAGHVPQFLQVLNPTQTRDSTGQSNSSSYPTSPSNHGNQISVKTEPGNPSQCSNVNGYHNSSNHISTNGKPDLLNSGFPIHVTHPLNFKHDVLPILSQAGLAGNMKCIPNGQSKINTNVPFMVTGGDQPLNFSKDHIPVPVGKVSPNHYSNFSGADDDCIQ